MHRASYNTRHKQDNSKGQDKDKTVCRNAKRGAQMLRVPCGKEAATTFELSAGKMSIAGRNTLR